MDYHIVRVVVSNMLCLSYFIKRHSSNYALGDFITLPIL